MHTHAAADTTSGVFDLARIPTIPASKLSGTLDIAGGGTGANNAADAAKNLALIRGITSAVPEENETIIIDQIKKIINDNQSLNIGQTIVVYAAGGTRGTAPTVIITKVSTVYWSGMYYVYGTNRPIRTFSSSNNGKTLTFFDIATTEDLSIKANVSQLNNYLPLTGGTLTGNIDTASVNIGSYESNIERLLSVRRGFSLDTDNPIKVHAMVNVGSNMALFSFRDSLNNIKNCLYLYEDRSVLAKPLTVSSGGTGANTAEQARENLGAAPEDHTHNYAGSSSPGGAATSANKLATARTIKLTGAVNGQATFDGSKDITINVEGDSAAAGFLAAHPVGSIYACNTPNNPGVTYGGTWQALASADSFKWLRIE